MTDMISKIAALKEIDWAINLAMDDEMHYAMCTLGERIEELPAIDAVPVVRCKDCKHRGGYNCPIDRTDGDGFCHRGEKKC